MMLAQLTVAPIDIGGWLLSAGSVIWIANQARLLFGGSQKRDVTLQTPARTVKECGDIHTVLAQALQRDKDNYWDEIKKRIWPEIAKNAAAVNAVLTEVQKSEIRMLEAGAKREAAIHQRIDELPTRIIQTLKTSRDLI